MPSKSSDYEALTFSRAPAFRLLEHGQMYQIDGHEWWHPWTSPQDGETHWVPALLATFPASCRRRIRCRLDKKSKHKWYFRSPVPGVSFPVLLELVRSRRQPQDKNMVALARIMSMSVEELQAEAVLHALSNR